MTILESAFMNRVPAELKRIADGLAKTTPRFVKVAPNAFLTPANISSLSCWEEGERPQNKRGGRVNISMTNGDVFETSFSTAEEAFAALGI